MIVSYHCSILGLKSSATDEDIRRYYKRQAVLVHPDKVSGYDVLPEANLKNSLFPLTRPCFSVVGRWSQKYFFNLKLNLIVNSHTIGNKIKYTNNLLHVTIKEYFLKITLFTLDNSLSLQ